MKAACRHIGEIGPHHVLFESEIENAFEIIENTGKTFLLIDLLTFLGH